jgi:uncharacterized protein
MTSRSILLAFVVVGCVAVKDGPVAADYAPLDCANAASPTEKTICSHYGLGQSEARMATLYQWSTAFVGMGQRGDMLDAQRDFLKRREQCGADVACLRRIYETRIGQLQSVMEQVRARGPF